MALSTIGNAASNPISCQLLYKTNTNQFVLGRIFFSSPAFPRELLGKQLQIKPPHLSINQHKLHFAWIKSQTVPTKILDIIEPFCLWFSNWPLPTHFSIQSLLGHIFETKIENICKIQCKI